MTVQSFVHTFRQIIVFSIYGFLGSIIIAVIWFIISLIEYIVNVQPRTVRAIEILKSNKQKSHQSTKQGFSNNKIDELEKEKPFDAIIIGSGISALTTGALLSRRGWKILCLEQHDVAGGCTHTFNEKGYEFDTGVHYIGADINNKKSLTGFLFDLVTNKNVNWIPMEDNFDNAKISNLNSTHSENPEEEIPIKSFAVTKNFKQFVKCLNETFPEEKSAIKSYTRLLAWADIVVVLLVVLKTIPLWLAKIVRRFLEPLIAPFTRMSTRSVLRTLTKNKTLMGCLTWCYGDYGLPPSSSSFLINCLVSSHYLQGNGGFYPEGGPSTIPESIIPIIEASGGKVFVRAPVSKILFSSDGKRAIGVTVRGRDIYAKTIISSVGVLNTYLHLIPDDPTHGFMTDKVKAILRREPTIDPLAKMNASNPCLEPSLAMFAVFVGVNGNPEELGIKAQNTWMYPSWDHDSSWKRYNDSVVKIRSYLMDYKDKNDFDITKAVDYEFPMLFISSSTAKDPSRHHLNKTSIELLTAVDYKAFSYLDDRGDKGKPEHRGPRYAEAKRIIEQKLLIVLKELFPSITDDRIEHVSSGSPLTSNFYYGTHSGEVYGLAHDCDRFRPNFDWLLRPKQEIEGFYMTGQDILTDGLIGAFMAGVMTSVVLDKSVLSDLIVSYVLDYVQ